MTIIRNAQVTDQIGKALALQTGILASLEAVGLSDLESNSFVRTLSSAAEAFKPVLKGTLIDTVDRKASMLAGPFFTSEENPIPATHDGMMLPIIQLDLRLISQLSGKEFGNGLLQLWCDSDGSNAARELIRVISREELDSQEITPFHYELAGNAEVGPVPSELLFDETWDEVDVIDCVESVGLHAQTSYLDVYAADLSTEQLETISEDLHQFMQLTDLPNEFHLFGSFYPIQYSTVDVGTDWECLVHFAQWGSGGNAQLFYHLSPTGGMTFSFQESLR